MKTHFFPKLLLMLALSLSLYSCTTEEMPANQNNNNTAPAVTADGADGGPVIPPGPRP